MLGSKVGVKWINKSAFSYLVVSSLKNFNENIR